MDLDLASVEDLVARRVAAREARDWAAADGLRDELVALGVGVQDGPEGSTWNFL
jgi:cysteinyl-tRNA synthetase